jgi:hypothetical protein
VLPVPPPNWAGFILQPRFILCSHWLLFVGLLFKLLRDILGSFPRVKNKGYTVFLHAYCKSEIRAQHADLVAYAATAKHQRSAAPFSNARNLFDVDVRKKTIDNSLKCAESKLAVHFACHSSVLTVDHLGELLKEITGKDKALHRTKCAALITRVLGPEIELGGLL